MAAIYFQPCQESPWCRSEQDPCSHPTQGGRTRQDRAAPGSRPAQAFSLGTGQGWPQGGREQPRAHPQGVGPQALLWRSCGSLWLSLLPAAMPQPSAKHQPLWLRLQSPPQRGARDGVESGEAAGQQWVMVSPARGAGMKPPAWSGPTSEILWAQHWGGRGLQQA